MAGAGLGEYFVHRTGPGIGLETQLVGRGAGGIVEAASTGIGPSIGWELLAFFGMPILGIVALARPYR